MLLDEVPLMENFGNSAAGDDARPDVETTALITADIPPVRLNSSSPTYQSQLQSRSHPNVPALPGMSAAAQSPGHSSPATSQSDVDVSSPLSSPDSTVNYAKAAENVLDTTNAYQHCGSHVQPFTANFDSQPASLVRCSEDRELDSNDCSMTSMQDSGKSCSSGKNADEGSLQRKDDACSSTDVSQNSSGRSSDMSSSYMTSAHVAASSDRGGEDAAESDKYSSQLETVESSGAKAVTGPAAAGFNTCQLHSSDDCAAVDSSSLDPGYQRATVSAGGFSTELFGSAAPLSPV